MATTTEEEVINAYRNLILRLETLQAQIGRHIEQLLWFFLLLS